MITNIEKHKIQNRIDREYTRSLAKHGNWDGYTIWDMFNAISLELDEVRSGVYNGDYTGEHGIFNELSQVAACCQKAMVQIIRRKFNVCEKSEINARQPMPVTNNHPAILDLVIEDIKERNAVGVETYGTRLQPFNGRKPLIDAYQEVLDMAFYIRQEIYEQEVGDGKPS